jgi:alginate O-acetyltransferase complex protein AlgI
MIHNFRQPYLSRSITEFWRRWHISLSTWLRDYLYVPLGGNRRGPARTYVNLIVVMLLGGLWHGASWTFVVWGGLHGLYLSVERALRRRFAGWIPGPLALLALGLLTWTLVNITWVFFRANGFDKASAVLRGMFGLNPDAKPILPMAHIVPVGLIVSGIVLAHWLMRERTLEATLARTPALVLSLAWGSMLFAIVAAQGVGNAFIYFQF